MVKEESEKSGNVKVDPYDIRRENPTDVEVDHAHYNKTDSRDSFWKSQPFGDLSPEQRKHFRDVMGKEVRK